LTWTLPAGYRGLIFDCDGTLVDNMPAHYRAWVAVLSRHDLELTQTRFYEWAGMPIDVIVQRLAKEKGLVVDAGSIAAERDAYFHSLPTRDLRPVAAVVEIARRYHGQHPMAVATDDVGRPKPAPDIFLTAAQRISVPPQECVVFEDGETGMEGAGIAGMHVVDVRPWIQRCGRAMTDW
jgi:beta-phosphoglucomutase-like phosphatase (HAD superfamily)